MIIKAARALPTAILALIAFAFNNAEWFLALAGLTIGVFVYYSQVELAVVGAAEQLRTGEWLQHNRNFVDEGEKVEPDHIPTPLEDVVLSQEIEEPPFIIGTTDAGKTITLDTISSLAVGGVPGSGKTVSMVGLSTQSVVKYHGNIRIVVIDPHMYTNSKEKLVARMEPLAPFYLNIPGLANPVSGNGDLLKILDWLRKKAIARIKDGEEVDEKILIVVDEFTNLMDDENVSEALTALLLMINEQARKVGMFAMVSSPQWKSSRVGGTEVRGTVAAFLIHNMANAVAYQLANINAAKVLPDSLAKGQAIFRYFDTLEVVRVKYLSPQEIETMVTPYIPKVVVEEVPEHTDEEAEVTAIYETFMVLRQDLKYGEEAAIRALAIDFFPGDPAGVDRIREAIQLGEYQDGVE